MNGFDIAGLFLLMAALAALPSTSVALVVTRSATLGAAQGVAVSLGVVTGDLLFVAMAAVGMTVLAEQLGAVFALLKYAVAAYLIWFGIRLMRSRCQVGTRVDTSMGSINMMASFTAGLLLTLADVKAIFFYASLLPLFFDPQAMSVGDIIWLCGVTVIAVGGVKIVYAVLAKKLASRFLTKRIWPNWVLGGVMIGVGGYLFLKGV